MRLACSRCYQRPCDGERARVRPSVPCGRFLPRSMSPVPVYNWTGIYLGINGGYTFGKQDPLSLISNNYSAFDYNANGWLVGGTFGAQIQSGHVVIGIEGDIDWTNIKGSGSGAVSFLGNPGTATLSSSVSSISTLRTRVGYASRQLALLRNCRRCRDKSLVHRHPNCWIGLRRS